VKQPLDSINHTDRIHRLCLEILHNLEKLIVNTRLISEFKLDLIEVKQGVFHS